MLKKYLAYIMLCFAVASAHAQQPDAEGDAGGGDADRERAGDDGPEARVA